MTGTHILIISISQRSHYIYYCSLTGYWI